MLPETLPSLQADGICNLLLFSIIVKQYASWKRRVTAAKLLTMGEAHTLKGFSWHITSRSKLRLRASASPVKDTESKQTDNSVPTWISHENNYIIINW